jgi:hypothetical protein
MLEACVVGSNCVNKSNLNGHRGCESKYGITYQVLLFLPGIFHFIGTITFNVY